MTDSSHRAPHLQLAGFRRFFSRRWAFRWAALTAILVAALGAAVRVGAQVLAAPYQTSAHITGYAPSPSYVGQPVMVAVQVAAALAPAAPTGQVEVRGSDRVFCTLTLDAAGEGSCDVVFDAPGTVSLQAFYLGGTSFLPSASAAVAHQVVSRSTSTVAITAHTPDPSILNRPVTAAAHVVSSGLVPTGTVTLFRSSSGACLAAEAAAAADRCTASLDAAGDATCALPLSAAGPANLCAAYSGDVATDASVSAPVVQQVSASNTFTEITRVDPEPSIFNQAAWVYFTVTSPDGAPGGAVTVTGGGGSCSGTVAEGRCALTLTQGGNEVALTAAYAGASQGQTVFQPSQSASRKHRVDAPPTDIQVTPGTVESFSRPGDPAGTLAASDPNAGESHTFSLVAGSGDTDNAYFRIEGNRLLARDTMPVVTGTVTIRVRATDPTDLSFEKALTLTVVNSHDLPNTGFAAGRVSVLPEQPAAMRYAATGGLELALPSLGVRVEIVGVPASGQGWDTTWLGEQAGWLEGTAFPTWTGNSALAAHNYLPSGEPGPFQNLDRLRYGDTVLIQAYGATYVYAVRSVELQDPADTSTLAHEDASWLTLITCHSYDESQGAYRWRVVVRAVLTEIR